MDNKGKNKNMIIGSVLGVMLLLAAEIVLMSLYGMQAEPYFLVGAVVDGLAMVGVGYLAASSIIKEVEAGRAHNDEIFADVIKSEKASYLLIKKHSEELTAQLYGIDDGIKAAISQIVAAQKATAKVTINRNKENTDALMNSNDKLLELVFTLDDKLVETMSILNEAKTSIGDSFEKNSEEANSKIIAKQQEIAQHLREMELALKNEILEAENRLTALSASQCQMASAPMMIAPQQMMPMTAPVAPVAPAPVPEVAPVVAPEPEPEPIIEPVDIPDLEPISESVIEEPVLDELNFGDLPDIGIDMDPSDLPAAEPELAMEEELVEGPVPELAFEEPIVEEPAVEEPIVEEVIPEPVAEEIVPEPVIEEAPVEEKPPMPDMSDPNAKMSPDDIAALFANLAPADEPAPAPEPEPVEEEVVPEPVIEEAPAEEKPPMPDMSDPNAKMSPDDIAALFANLAPADEPAPAPEPEPEPEPVVEEKPPMPDMSDPNAKMSPDDIAALFANLAPADEPAPAPEPEPEPEPVVEEKPPMPDLSDPNKKMTPEEIAALFANMG